MNIVQTMLDALFGIIASLLLFFGSLVSILAPQQVQNIPLPKQPVATPGEFPTPAPAAPDLPESASKPVAKPATPASAPPATAPTPVVPAPAPAKPQAVVNDETRAALVNILCLPQVGISGISGSGVVIDSRGVILTNAHIGQYFLLRNYIMPNNINCVVRIGSPAEERYTATLLYLPPAWIADNASQLTASQATGTGENDYALLLITGRTDPNAALPGSFQRLEMDRGYQDTGNLMLLAAYPAGFLSGEIIQKSLYASSAIAYVTQLFSFSGNKKVDLFSVGGTVVSQGGSSGGAAVRLDSGKLAGVIVTATTAASTGERDLRVLSLAHIDDSLAAGGKGGIVSLLTGDLSAKAADFAANVAPSLTAALETVLKPN